MALFDFFRSKDSSQTSTSTVPETTKAAIAKFKEEEISWDKVDYSTFRTYKKLLSDQAAAAYLASIIEKPTENEKKYRKKTEQKAIADKRVATLKRFETLHAAETALKKGNGDQMAALYLSDSQAYEAVMGYPEDVLDEATVAETRMSAISDLSKAIETANQSMKNHYEGCRESEAVKAVREFASAGDVVNCRKALKVVQETYKNRSSRLMDIIAHNNRTPNDGRQTVTFMVAVSTLPTTDKSWSADSEASSRATYIADLNEGTRQEILSGIKDHIDYSDPNMAKMLTAYVIENHHRRNSIVGTVSQETGLQMLVGSNGFNILDQHAMDRYAQEDTTNVVNTFYNGVTNRLGFEYETKMRGTVLADMDRLDKFIAGHNIYNARKENPSSPMNYSTLGSGKNNSSSVALPAHIATLLYEERLKDQYNPKEELSLETGNSLTAFNNIAFDALSVPNNHYGQKPIIALVKNVLRMEKVEDEPAEGASLEAIQGNFDETVEPRYQGQSFDMLTALQNKGNPLLQTIRDELKEEYRAAAALKSDNRIKPNF